MNSKNAFWQALVVTVFIFVAGLILGFYIELSNTSKSDFLIRSSEVDFLDQQMKVTILSNDVNFNCENARKNLFKFADQIYLDAVELEEEGSQSKLTTNQKEVLHKRYDLLRLNLWMESLKLRERCEDDFHTLLYLFDYNSEDVRVKSEQNILGMVLLDLRYKYPDEIFLLPVAANLNLESVDMIKENYNISKSPSLLIDEFLVLDSPLSLNEIEYEIFNTKESKKIIILRS